MNSRTGIRVLCGALLLGGLFGLFLTTAHAQTVDTGLGVIGQTTGLTATDPRIIAARIINIVLGFLAIILTAVILYAGFLWMTAGGDSKQVDHAKDMIRNGIIGVIIILSSWAIVTFVISRLLDATGGGGGGISNNDGNNGGDFGGGQGGALGFQIRSIRPTGDVRLRNPEVVFIFSRDVRESTVAAAIKVSRADNGAVVSGTLTTEGSLVTFVPVASCPAPHADRRCFEENTEYVLSVERSLRSSVGQSLACGGLAPACSVRFRTGSIVDVLAPRLSIHAPFFGQNVPANDNVAVSTYAEDDSGISFIESFADGRSIGLATPSGTSTDTFFDGTIYWNTHGVATGVHQLVSRTKDLDSNRTTSSAVSVMVRPQHCFNLIQDEGETGLNCGGECGTCSGDRAESDLDCASGVRDAGGLCVDQPIITGVTPFDGRPGTFVSVRGVNFGSVAGTVEIGGRLARAPDACASVASSLWTPSLVVVEVPEGATTGTVKITHQNRRFDTTTDTQGPLLGEFRVNTRTYPGLCSVTPESARIGETRRLDMNGVNLGVSSDRVYFNDRMFNSFLSWADRGIGISSPLIESGGYAVSAQVRGVNSNPVFFRQQDRLLSDRPVIDSVVPATGTIGGYITITGRNFGERGQVFFRQGALHGPADVTFPAACSDNYWRNGSITVKVPRQILDGLGRSQTLATGAYGLVVSRDSVSESAPASFEVVNGVPGPGICGIQPMAGPSGTPVTIVGERFGTSASRITFAGATGDLDATIGTWADQSIQTTVPLNAITGLVHITAGGIRSNGVNFSARNCNEEASVCENGQACCRDGSCAVNGVCRAMATNAQMSWRSSTGRIVLNPTVVEECSAQNPPSPSPWSTRSGGGDVCVNAQVVIGFTTRIDTATLTPTTVVVTQCTGTGSDPCASGTPVTVAGSLVFQEHDTGTYVVFTPNGTTFWQPNATFQVELKTAIRATRAAGGLPMLEDRARYGRGNAYAFRFHTRATSELCQIHSVSVSPYNWVMEQLGLTKRYTLSARSEDMCVQLNASSPSIIWAWSITGASGRAGIAPVVGQNSDVQNVTGLGATEVPLLVNTELISPVPPSPVRGAGSLSIRLSPPTVVEYGPNCNQACVNAAVWAKFSTTIDQTSLSHLENGVRVPNMVIKRCTNESCRTFVEPPLAITPDMLSLRDAPGQSQSTGTLLVMDSHEVTLLEREKFYKVWILGGDQGIRDSYGHLPLSGLNDSDPVGFSWTFQVRGGTNPVCSVDRITVTPGQKIADAIGDRQLFTGQPFGAPDICSATGQMLITNQSFRWETSAPDVADFAQIGETPGRLSLAVTMPAYCTNRCLNTGSQGVYQRTAICGNRRVETSEVSACHRRTDPTQACVIGSTDCENRAHENCLLMPPGSIGSEQCDSGAPNCTTSCLWAGRPAVAARGTCGNGTVDVGESCDAGAICLGGPTPGRDCTRDITVCGTGGQCNPAIRYGCSSSCVSLGATLGNSTCGNRDVADGETCDDGNRFNGDGCNSDCLQEGSSSGLTSFCGDGTINPGESCEVSAAGDVTSQYCHLVAGVRTCVPGSVFQNSCDTRTCLNKGTVPGAAANQCGNGAVDPGEDCDGGQGCSARCLALGSSLDYQSPSICGDRLRGVGETCEAPSDAQSRVSNTQLFEITGLRGPTETERRDHNGEMTADLSAEYDSHTGQATYGVACHFTSELQCLSGTGLTSGGCCAPRPHLETSYPSAQNVCRNTLIYARFDQPMDTGTIDRNFFLAKSVDGVICPANTTPLEDRAAVAGGFRGWIARFWHQVVAFFSADEALATNVWCVGSVAGHTVFTEDRGKTVANFVLNAALEPETTYRVILKGESDLSRAVTSTRGIRSSRGVLADGDLGWTFRTGRDICTVSRVDIQDTQRAHPFLFYRANETHRYASRAVALNGGVEAPIVPIDGLYSWAWQRWTTTHDDVITVEDAPSSALFAAATTTAPGKNGSSLVGSSLMITSDRVSTSTTLGYLYAATRLSTVLVCENPWVPDQAVNVDRLPLFQDLSYNFATTYCRDYGLATSVNDDLPSLLIHYVTSTASDRSRGVLAQYLFSFDNPFLRGDGLGIRIIANPLHESPSAWYLSQGFNGTPEVTTVDGYEALRDGSTMYVGILNTDVGMSQASSSIFVISRNPNAGPEAQRIYSQLVANLSFNTNVAYESQNVCVGPAGVQYQDPTSRQLIRCTADWECLRRDSGLHCSSAKEKMQRDQVRLSDFQALTTALESTKARSGNYPVLTSGTQLTGFVTSRWAGWQSALGASLGNRVMPEDPINALLSCGRCEGSTNACSDNSECGAGKRCLAKDGRDPASCWSAASSTYMCPILNTDNPYSESHVYQYRAIGGGSRFELATELEAIPATSYNPPLVSEVRRCSSGRRQICIVDTDCAITSAAGVVQPVAAGVCAPAGGRWVYDGICRNQPLGAGQQCGDGVIDTRPGSVEICEIGQTQEAACSVGSAQGSIIQVCTNDCRGFVTVPGAMCQPDTLCGNGRVDTKRCTGGSAAGPRFGASCRADTDCDTGVTCQTVAVPETCDDGAQSNGTYGHCNRTCTGYSGSCGDNTISPGERCDLGADNGLYCDTRGVCDLAQTCNAECSGRAPYCGDSRVTDGEECDVSSPARVTTSAVCSTGAVGKECSNNNDCSFSYNTGGVTIRLPGSCGLNADDRSCTAITAGLCNGGQSAGLSCSCGAGAAAGTTCASDVCGTSGRCVTYTTQRTSTCTQPDTDVGSNQCKWHDWSQCLPVGRCGDGVVNTGELCDDGNTNNNDACTNSCKANVCGDTVLYTGVEECDSGAAQNGQPCTTAEYGSTCVACTAQCRMTASTGGYCGNNRREGSEQCDGRDLGPRATSLTCQSLGYDYLDASAISCSRTCAYAGCKYCREEQGTESITATVYDAQYSSLPVPNARVTLYQRGNPVGVQYTAADGTFTFSSLSAKAECSQYRIVVDSTQDNPRTLTTNEAVTGGYWAFESQLFTAATFYSDGIRSTNDHRIYLVPKVGRGETLVVHTWDGSLGRRFLLSHLILPANRAYQFVPGGTGFAPGTTLPSGRGCGTDQPSSTCFRDIHEQNNPAGFQGGIDLGAAPYARLFCPGTTNAGAACYEMATAPQATRYHLQSTPNGRLAGTFNYYLSDQRSSITDTRGHTLSTPISSVYYRQTKSTVYVVTQTNIYTINPPSGDPQYCNGKYWHVFSQDAVTGEITIPSLSTGAADNADLAYQCGGDPIPGETSNARLLPTNTTPTSDRGSWMHFGGIEGGLNRDIITTPCPTAGNPGRMCYTNDYTGIDWDMRSSTPIR